MTAPLITLNDGNAIPSVGLGVFQTPPKATALPPPSGAMLQKVWISDDIPLRPRQAVG